MHRDDYMTPKWLAIPLIGFYFYLIYMYATDIKYFGFLDNMNLLIHEAGHFVFMFFGEFISILGGSLLQTLMPLLFGGYFVLRKDWLAISFVMGWLATNLFYVATYVADAQEMVLPMLFDGMIHDWNYLLTQLNLLESDDSLAFAIRVFAWGCLLIAIGLAATEFLSPKPKKLEVIRRPIRRLPINFQADSSKNAGFSILKKNTKGQ